MKTVKRIIFALLILGIFLTIFWFVGVSRVYQAFSKEELFATVTCQRSHETSFDYIIFYQPITQKQPTAFGIRGNQWRIEGVIIKWKGFVNILGIHTWHKPVRLSGRFSYLKGKKSFGFTDYVLNNGEDSFWKFASFTGKFLPFVEAAYGSAAFIPCRENIVFKVYVTTSGYMIKTEDKQMK